jgi:vesicle-fusing ATPase
LDQLERLLEYVPIGPRFSNPTLQTLMVLLKKIPPKGRKLLVLASTSTLGMLESLGLAMAFSVVVTVPLMERGGIIKVFSQMTSVFDQVSVEQCADMFTDGIGAFRAAVRLAISLLR